MKRLVWIISLLIISSVFWMCEEDETDEGTSETTLSGGAVKGVIQNAEVNVYAFDENELRGELLASAETNSEGEFTVSVDHVGGVEIVVTGGSYSDEATGEEVSMDNFEFRNVVMSDDKNEKTVGVTALTTIAAENIDENASEGLATAIENANNNVASAFGLGDTDISSTVPADLTRSESIDAEQSELSYGAAQAGLSNLVKTEGLNPEDLPELINAMGEDFRDGNFDGKDGEEALEFALSVTPQEALDGLQTAIDNFLNGSQNTSDYLP
ncbi:MAG: hypothetical protein KGY69_13885 [Bacteroidales bacterium]|nr:hypothetical protein [Bacteroidales bacterium]